MYFQGYFLSLVFIVAAHPFKVDGLILRGDFKFLDFRVQHKTVTGSYFLDVIFSDIQPGQICISSFIRRNRRYFFILFPYQVFRDIHAVFIQHRVIDLLGVDVFCSVDVKYCPFNRCVPVIKHIILCLIFRFIHDKTEIIWVNFFFQGRSRIVSIVQFLAVLNQLQDAFLLFIVLEDSADQVPIRVNQSIFVLPHLSIRINGVIINNELYRIFWRIRHLIGVFSVGTGICQDIFLAVLDISGGRGQFCNLIYAGRKFCWQRDIAVHDLSVSVAQKRRRKRVLFRTIFHPGCRLVIPDIVIIIQLPACLGKGFHFPVCHADHFNPVRRPFFQYSPLHQFLRFQHGSVRRQEIRICFYQTEIGFCLVIGYIPGCLRHAAFRHICVIGIRVFVNFCIVMVAVADICLFREAGLDLLLCGVGIYNASIVADHNEERPCHHMFFRRCCLYHHISSIGQLRGCKSAVFVGKHFFYPVFVCVPAVYRFQPQAVALCPGFQIPFINSCGLILGKVIIIKLLYIQAGPAFSICRGQGAVFHSLQVRHQIYGKSCIRYWHELCLELVVRSFDNGECFFLHIISGINGFISRILIVCCQRIIVICRGFIPQDHSLRLIVIGESQVIGRLIQHITLAGLDFFQGVFPKLNVVEGKFTRSIPVLDFPAIGNIPLAVRVQHVAVLVHNRGLSDCSGHDQIALMVDHAGMTVCMDDIFRSTQFINRALQCGVALDNLALRLRIILHNGYAAFCPFIRDGSLVIGSRGLRGLVIIAVHYPFFRPGSGDLEIIGVLPVCVVVLPSCRMSGDQFHQPVLPVSEISLPGLCLHQIKFALVLVIPVYPVA